MRSVDTLRSPSEDRTVLLFDVYVLAPERTARVAERFLDEFVSDREQARAEFEFPQYADSPRVALRTAADAIRYCEGKPTDAQHIYFRNRGAGPPHAVLLFTEDGSLILGLSIVASEDGRLDSEAGWLKRLKSTAGSSFGLVTLESLPPLTADEFKRRATE